MLIVNKHASDSLLIEIENQAPDEGVGVQYKDLGIFIKPSTDYSDISAERNVSASEDYLNILKDAELKITSITLTNAAGRSAVTVPGNGIAFTFEKGDRYKTKIHLLEKLSTEDSTVFPVGGKLEVRLEYTGSVNKRISIEVETGGSLPVEEDNA